jgi:hypothetical protein
MNFFFGSFPTYTILKYLFGYFTQFVNSHFHYFVNSRNYPPLGRITPTGITSTEPNPTHIPHTNPARGLFNVFTHVDFFYKKWVEVIPCPRYSPFHFLDLIKFFMTKQGITVKCSPIGPLMSPKSVILLHYLAWLYTFMRIFRDMMCIFTAHAKGYYHFWTDYNKIHYKIILKKITFSALNWFSSSSSIYWKLMNVRLLKKVPP